MLKNCLRLAHCKDPCIVECGDRFIYQYGDKASVFISKLDSKIYSDVDNDQSRRQAIFLLRILHRFNLVSGYRRKQEHKRKSISGWIE